jgi:hypothetical protein
MGFLDNIKKKAISGEIQRLLSVYKPVLDSFGISVDEEKLKAKVMELYDAKPKSGVKDGN